MAKAYRAIEKASALMLDYGDVMRPYKMSARKASAKKGQISKAVTQLGNAVKAAEHVGAHAGAKLAGAEAELWNYGLPGAERVERVSARP